VSGVFGSFFHGQAAQTTDESLRRWRQLFQVEEQIDLQRQQLEQAVTLQEDSQAHAVELAELQARLANENLDRQEAFKIGETLFTSQEEGRTPLDQQYAIAETMSANGNRWAKLYEDNIRSSLLGSSEDTIASIDALFSAKPGDKFNAIQYRAAAPAYANFAGLEGKERENFIQQVNDLVSHYNSLGAEVEDAAMRRLEAEVTNLEETVNATRANIVHTRAQTDETIARTDLIGQQTAKLGQDILQSAELFPHIKEGQRLQNINLEGQNERIRIENDYLPEQITAGLANLYAQTRDLDNGNKLFEATFDDMVAKIAAESQITQEEARHKLATAMARDGIVNADAEQARKALELMDLQIAGQEHALKEAKLSLYNDLLERGQPELVRALAPDLLANVEVSDEDREKIIAMGEETAGQRRVTTSDLERAQATIALAESAFAESTLEDRVAGAKADSSLRQQQAATFADQQAFDNRIKEMQARAYVDNLRTEQGLTGGLMSSPDAFKRLDDDNVGNVTGFYNEIQEWNSLAGELDWLNRLQSGGISPAEVQELQSKGISPEAFEAYRSSLAAKVNAEQTTLVNRFASFAAQYRALTGSILRPDLFGMDKESDIYVAAVLERDPSYRQIVSDDKTTQAVHDAVTSYIDTAALSGDRMRLTGGPIAVWDKAVEELGEEALNAAGYNGPESIEPLYADALEQVSVNRSTAQEGMVWASQYSSFPLEFSIPQDRMEAARIIDGRVNLVQGLAEELENLPVPTARQDLGVLGIGNPDRAYDLYLMGQKIMNRTGLDAATLQQEGFMDTFGNITDVTAATTFLYQYADRLANQSLGIKFFNGKMN
jgi:hypothetical protein